MTDQTRWGIPEVQLKNKHKKYQKDLLEKALEFVNKMDDETLCELALVIEAEYERKYGENKAERTIL